MSRYIMHLFSGNPSVISRSGDHAPYDWAAGIV